MINIIFRRLITRSEQDIPNLKEGVESVVSDEDISELKHDAQVNMKLLRFRR